MLKVRSELSSNLTTVAMIVSTLRAFHADKESMLAIYGSGVILNYITL